MSIYVTLWVLKFPRGPDARPGCEWVKVIGQGVPAHIGTPSPGYGYESGDPYAGFLPPAILVPDGDDGLALRAVVIAREGTEKAGQRYIGCWSCPVGNTKRCRSANSTNGSAMRCKLRLKRHREDGLLPLQ